MLCLFIRNRREAAETEAAIAAGITEATEAQTNRPAPKPIPVSDLRFERIGPGVLMLRGNLEKPGAMQRLRELLNTPYDAQEGR